MTGHERAPRRTTPRGEHRRDALVTAAAELLAAEGFGAVSHRAVAVRAGLPLAATTYYFASRDDLVRAAVERLGHGYAAHAAGVVASLPERPLDDRALADALVSLVTAGGGDGEEALLTFYERFVQAGREPGLRDLVVAWTADLVEAVEAVVRRSGRTAEPPVPRLLVALIDGLLLARLAEREPDALARVRADLAEALPRLLGP